MAEKLMVVEIDRRPRTVRDESAHDRDARDRLTRQLRRAIEQKNRAFDQGMLAAIEMFEHGASIERLRGMLRAQGTRGGPDRPSCDPDGDETGEFNSVEI